MNPRSLLHLLCIAVALPLAATDTREAPPVQDGPPRSVVVISDLHMGLGRDEAGTWSDTEDFRWPRALASFLDEVSQEGEHRVDLVIAGDFLELWQWPNDKPCGRPRDTSQRGAGPNCTVGEMRDLTEKVVAAHAQELDALARFAARGDNCVTVVPGNHDAALMVDRVWEPVATALGKRDGCVHRETGLVWTSADGRLMVEHGHQIGHDANQYPNWPRVTRRKGGRQVIRQPWGERFVQDIFNAEEGDYPLIDNLSPSSAGVRYRMADRGFARSAGDVARFLRFNLFDTSLRQKVQILGDEDEPPPWDPKIASELGHRLIVASLPEDDPLTVALASGGDEWQEVRNRLDAEVRQLPQEELLALCDLAALRGGRVACQRAELGAGVERLIFSRGRILKKHLKQRHEEADDLRSFVYGHTHSFERPWLVATSSTNVVRVANSGAFQRLVDDERLRELAAEEGMEPAAFLRQRSPEDLPACYTAVQVSWDGKVPRLELRAWWMEEDAAHGEFVDPCGERCPNIGHGCGS